MFNCLLIIGKSRYIYLVELLSYALSPVPNDGTRCKTVYAKLMHELEEDVVPLALVPVVSALIVHSPNPHDVSTFGQLTDILLQDLMHMAIQFKCLRVDFVCDPYPMQSAKNCERERRAMSGTQVIHITRPDQQTLKQFKKYLANGRNK